MLTDNCSSKICGTAKTLDSRHINLLELLNYLKSEKELYEDQTVVEKVLDSVVSHTMSHLKREEELMEECTYSGCTFSKSIHNNKKLLQKLMVMKEDYCQGNTDIFLDILSMLNDWMAKYIPVEDSDFASIAA